MGLVRDPANFFGVSFLFKLVSNFINCSSSAAKGPGIGRGKPYLVLLERQQNGLGNSLFKPYLCSPPSRLYCPY